MRRLLLFTIALLVIAHPLARADSRCTTRPTLHGTPSPPPSRSTPRDAARAARQLARMAQRLSVFTTSQRFAVPDPPLGVRTEAISSTPTAYNDALIYGDPAGAAYLAVSHPVVNARALLGRLTPAADEGHCEPPGHDGTRRRGGDGSHQRHRPPPAERPHAGTAGDRCA